jgi:TPP-dependent pyruvate/acetoin dehydrogenase alpha subunit
VTVVEPVASAAAQPPRGIWTEEQAEALRARVRDATTKAVDRAASAVIETVNSLAAAIRARSERRGDGDRR